MKIGSKILHFLGIDSHENYLWSKNVKEYSNLENDVQLTETSLLRGTNSCDISLLKNANIEVQGELNGSIYGKENNVVRVKGTLKGNINCKKLIVYKSAIIIGEITTEKLLLEDGSTLDVKITMKGND